MRNLAALALSIVLSSGVAVAIEPDAEGCADHPLLTRMAGYRIVRCRSVEFEALEFVDAKGKEGNVEGKFTEIVYGLPEGAAGRSTIQVIRNYENAFKAIGGRQVSLTSDGGQSYLTATKGDKVVWAVVNGYNPADVVLRVVEKEAMRQDVVADAASLSSGLKESGHVAIYGIYFDFGKSDVKPESGPALSEIAKLLSRDQKLKLYVVGHSDPVGQLDSNMKLSQARAEAVARVLTTKHGVAATRLKGVGVGPVAPVASNATEEGRAKNRRVELVEQ